MNITVIAVGKLKETFWTQACEEYLKRLQPYAKVVVREIPDVDPAKVGGETQELKKEGEAILHALDGLAANTHVVLLAINGKELSSVEFAKKIDTWALRGTSDIAFVIGGSCGVSELVAARCQTKLSFGRITLPHNLARVVLLEQLYRAFKISRGEPYHK